MPRYAPNKMSIGVKRRYFELIRSGVRGSVAAREVGVSVSCGSVWFVEAGRMHLIERPINRRYFNQDDRIEIAEGLAVGRPVKVMATRRDDVANAHVRPMTAHRIEVGLDAAGKPLGWRHRFAAEMVVPALYGQARLDAQRGVDHIVSYHANVSGYYVPAHLAEHVVRETLGLPDEVRMAALIPIGWPDRPHGPVNRKPVDEVIHWEGWQV